MPTEHIADTEQLAELTVGWVSHGGLHRQEPSQGDKLAVTKQMMPHMSW